jgi:uncharacterized protein YeaO (DUF488 family)
MAKYKIKRVYEPATKADGLRVLVDRLWPRGVRKETIDFWFKEIAPSTELRKLFHQGKGDFPEFAKSYRAELAQNPAVVEASKLAKKHRTITLLYAARDTKNNHAVVLKKILEVLD